MPGIDIDNVESGCLCTQRCIAVPQAHLGNIGLVHLLALPGRIKGGQAFRPKRRFARPQVRGVLPAVPQFHPRQRAMRVNGIGHSGQIAGVGIIPQAGIGIAVIVG